MTIYDKGLSIINVIRDSTLNIPNNDVKACYRCGEVIPLKIIITITGFENDKPVYSVRYDRTNRVDCDASEGDEPAKDVTYHKMCYVQEFKEES